MSQSLKFFALDFETYYDKEYSLRRMTNIEYVLDKRFECIGCAVVNNEGVKVWLTPDQLRMFLAQRNGERWCFVSHNALFDMLVLAVHFGFTPDLMIDTLGMARALLRKNLPRLSLEAVAKHLGLGVKGKTVQKVIGMNRQAIIAAGLMKEYGQYSINDADLCFDIFKGLAPDFPIEEMVTMDAVIRMTVLPQFKLDLGMLSANLYKVQTEKEALLAATGMQNRDALMSNDQFAAVLQSLGVDPPQKFSAKQNKMIWAFAKTDAEFTDLEEHDDPSVQALVAARLGLKSTIEETRCQRLINITHLYWPDGSRGWMPFPLKYSGAHTHRFSGDWKLNMQNLPRPIEGDPLSGALRRSLIAPDGMEIVTCDAAQIEARIVATLSRQLDLMAAFAAGEDIYSTFASIVFGVTVSKKTHPRERFMGKTAVLGLGFNLGWPKFQTDVKVKSGLAFNGQQIILSDVEAERIVRTYRTTYYMIPRTWKIFQDMIPQMCRKDCNIQFGPLTFMYQKVRLPNGMFIYYEGLNYDAVNKGWKFFYGGAWKYLYGGKIMENVVQALARIITMGAARRATPRIGSHLALQVHDELGYVRPAWDVARTKQILLEEMRIPPFWMPDLPLAAEAGSGVNYGEAK